MDFKSQLKERIYKQHCVGCAVATIVNLIWALTNYFVIEQGKWIYVSINLVAAGIIGLTLWLCRTHRISGIAMGMIPMLITMSAFAYTFNSIDLQSFEKVVYMYVAAFVGAGMFLLWDRRYSMIASFSAIGINGIFYVLFSPIPFVDYLLNGGLLVITVAIFMVISIDIRYKLVKSQLATQIALENSQELLKKSEEDYRMLFEKNPIPMVILTRDFCVMKMNEAMERLREQIHPDDDLLAQRLGNKEIKRQFEEGYFEKEWEGRKKDGSSFTVSSDSNEITYKGEQMLLISLNDLTEIKAYQKDLIEAKKHAEESKELQSQFLSNMSHEIRTPMNGIIGLTNILLETVKDDDQQRYLKAVHTSADNLMVIINDILDFSKIEAGKIQIEQTPFQLEESLNAIHEILCVKAMEKGIYLDLNIDKKVPKTLLGDPVRLNQILMNLIGNAIKFTEKGGVRIQVNQIGQSDSGQVIRFAIRDTGIGIAEDKIDTVFESFTQASMSTTRTHGGTGLGLTISKQLAEIQGGKIWVESEIGKGSCFMVEIPYKIAALTIDKTLETQQLQYLTKERQIKHLEGIQLLLVEDHPINQMLALKVLGDWGFSVDLAENGRIALDMVGKKAYDLILMDISMPEMDGYEATKEIRSGKYSDNPGIPIVAMTASALIGENQKCFKAGMNDYLSKPFKPEVLLEKIHKHALTHLKRA